MRALAITGIDTVSTMLVDHVGVAHPRDPALGADVGGHAFERHHGHCAGVLGDLGLGSAVTTSMMTPPLSISAIPRLTRADADVPCSLGRVVGADMLWT